MQPTYLASAIKGLILSSAKQDRQDETISSKHGHIHANAQERRLDFDCGISYERIASWLDDELHLPFDQERWAYAAEMQSCLIALNPLDNRTFGVVNIERSHLTAQGDHSAVDSFEKLFTLRFASAGG